MFFIKLQLGLLPYPSFYGVNDFYETVGLRDKKLCQSDYARQSRFFIA